MNNEKYTNEKYTNDEKYTNSVHRLGRLGSIISIILIVGLPIVICAVYNIFPTMTIIFSTSIALLALFLPIVTAEVISYAPVLGSATYLAFITGNVVNLKLPVALNAIKLADVEQSTAKGDAIVTVAIATSSIATMIVIVIGVMLLVPLQPILSTPVVQTATQYMLPALFGGLVLGILGGAGGKYIIKGKALAMIPALIIVTTLILIGIPMALFQGFAILGMIPVTILTARIMYKKGIIKITEKVEPVK